MSQVTRTIRCLTALAFASMLAATTLFLPATAFATGAWSWQNPLPQGIPLNAVHMTDATHGWAVGQAGTLLTTSDDGAHWAVKTTGTTSALTSLAFFGSSAWAVGEDGTIISSWDNGTYWNSQTSGTNNRLNGVAFADANHGWVVGDNGTILVTADGGGHWSAQGSGTGERLYSVAFSDASHGWAVGDQGVVLGTADGGAHWTTQATGTTNTLYSVAALDSSHACVVGDLGVLLRMTDGSHWTAMDSGTASRLYAVTFNGSANGWAVGDEGVVVATTDGGADWAAQPSATPGALRGVSFYDSLNGCAVGAWGVAVTTSDGGATWALKTTGPTETIWSTSFVSDTDGWAVGDSGRILCTTDGGAHWAPQSSNTLNGLWAVSFVDANHGWAVGDNGTIRVTSDGGAHWGAQSSGTVNGLFSVHFVDASHGWVTGVGGVILYTDDAGAHWVGQVSGTTNNLWSASFADATHGWAVGDNDTILATADGGATWTIQPYGGTTDLLTSVCAVDSTHAWATGDDGTIIVTTDGTTWAPQTSHTTDPLYSISFADATHGWAVGGQRGGGAGTVVSTKDGGLNWTPVHLGNPFFGVGVADVNHVWAVGQSGTIFAFVDGNGDTAAPATTLLGVPDGWTNQPIIFSLSANDFGGSGVSATSYTLNGGPATPYTIPVGITAEGITTIGYMSIDASGNSEPTHTAFARIDETSPTVSLDASGAYQTTAVIHASGSDALSGFDHTDLKLDSGSWTKASQLTVTTYGNHTIYARAFDRAGNEADTSSTFSVLPPPDVWPPTTTISGVPSGWTSATVTFSLSAIDTGISGVANSFDTLNGGVTTTYTAPVPVSAEGTTTIGYFSVDASGNIETQHTALARIDKSAPALSLDATSSYTASATIRATASDAISGLATTEIKLDGGAWVGGTQVTTTVMGAHTVYARALDRAGNERDLTATFTVAAPPDTKAPTTSIHGVSNGWVPIPVSFSLDATDEADGSGVAHTYYAESGASSFATATYAGPVVVTADGATTITYWSVDAAGNAETPHTAVVRLDRMGLSFSLDAVGSYVRSATIRATASNPLSGVNRVELKLDAGAWVPGTQITVTAPGRHTLYARAFDGAGNERDLTAVFTVTMPTSLSAPLASGKPVHTKSTTFYGSASPPRLTSLRLTIQTKTGGKWKPFKATTIRTSSSGKWTYKIKLAKATYRLQTSMSAATGYGASTSAWRSVTVK